MTLLAPARTALAPISAAFLSAPVPAKIAAATGATASMGRLAINWAGSVTVPGFAKTGQAHPSAGRPTAWRKPRSRKSRITPITWLTVLRSPAASWVASVILRGYARMVLVLHLAGPPTVLKGDNRIASPRI